MFVIYEIKGNQVYLGAPDIYGDNIVWHQGEWTKEMKAKVYLFNLKNQKLEKISKNIPAITPRIWGNLVVWNTYLAEYPEVKNIDLYNILTKEIIKITNYNINSRMEAWGPTIWKGNVTWMLNKPQKVSFYSNQLNKITTIDTPTISAGLHNNWLIWTDPPGSKNKSNGIYIFNLENITEN